MILAQYLSETDEADLIPRDLSKSEKCELTNIGSNKLDILMNWTYSQFSCSHCKKCTHRCEVLSGPELDMGMIESAYNSIISRPYDEQPAATIEYVQEHYDVYNALRQCCFCGHCTSACRRHVLSVDKMRVWRELFMRANLMPPDDSKLVMVDNEWDIFSAYRAIYQIGYPEFISLDQAADEPGLVDTLFFPGCSLVSYAPEVMKAIGNWLTSCGIKWALSDGCCGSPLMSAGLFERAANLRQRFVDKMRQAKITKMICICPGCMDEFHSDVNVDIEIIPLPELMLKLAEARESQPEGTGFSPLDLSSVTFFDSCHDRHDMRNALAIRRLLALYIPEATQHEFEHNKRDSLCCGAGGAVASYDPAITDRRVWRVIDEAHKSGGKTLISMCPTCTYTFGQANLSGDGNPIESYHYLEALFGITINWEEVFANLNNMWTGEYGPWLNATFF